MREDNDRYSDGLRGTMDLVLGGEKEKIKGTVSIGREEEEEAKEV